jgi:Flp pilus assembly protein TadG
MVQRMKRFTGLIAIRLRRDEQGVTLVLMSITLTMMLGFSALVVDLGAARQLKRQSANTADAASLGATQDLPDIASAASTVKSLAQQNFDVALSEWAGCTDDNPLEVQQDGIDGTACISYDRSFTTMRVKVPGRVHHTFFAQLIGVNELTVSAGAAARLVTSGFGGIQPFALYAGGGGGNGHACLKSSSGGHASATPPCNGPESGNFGALDLRQYGNDALGTERRCGNGDNNDRFANNIALGADHVISVYSGTEIVDECTGTTGGNANPNTLEVKTGAASAFEEGFVESGLDVDSYMDDGGPARLKRGLWPKRHIDGHDLDDRGFWEYIGDTAGLSDVPTSCYREVFTNALVDADSDNKTQLRSLIETCISHYNASATTTVAGCNGVCTGDLFTRNTIWESPIDLYDIQTTPRFAYVPRFIESSPPSGNSGMRHVGSFAAVFLQRLFGGCNSNSCNIDFEPGVGTTPLNDAGGTNYVAITAFILPADMLPGTLGTDPFAVGENIAIELVQ